MTSRWCPWPIESPLRRWVTRSSPRKSCGIWRVVGLTGSRGDYRLINDVSEISVPATVQAVLAARIDRLSTEAKSILNAAAVIGTQFDADTLHTLLPDAQPSRLADLVSAKLIDQTEFVPKQRYCFRHPLVRTVLRRS